MKIKNYKDLMVWKKGIDIVDNIYSITEKYPETERFGLVSQMRRCSVSVPSNIAEGFMRQHEKEYVQFLYVALGSCAELETQLIISEKRRFLSLELLSGFQSEIDYECRMLQRLIQAIKN